MSLPAYVTRLMTFAEQGEPKSYAASDMMRADLEALLHSVSTPDSELIALLRRGAAQLEQWDNLYRQHNPHFDSPEGGGEWVSDVVAKIGTWEKTEEKTEKVSDAEHMSIRGCDVCGTVDASLKWGLSCSQHHPTIHKT